MYRFFDGNPTIPFLYTLAVVGISAFSLHPALLVPALLGALLCCAAGATGATGASGASGATGISLRFHGLAAVLFLVSAIINPLVSQNGVTVLLFLGDRAVTAEAVLYGVAAASMIVSALYRFLVLSRALTADRLLYLTGRLSPRLSLVLSMAMRFVPLFFRRAAAIRETQTALGLYREDRLFPRIKGGLRVFSVLLTWSLENGIVTADSMAARGYGTLPRRTSFSRIRFTKRDGVRLSLVLLLTAGTLVPLLAGALDFDYYPAVSAAGSSPLGILGQVSFGILSFLPLLTDVKEALLWKLCESKI